LCTKGAAAEASGTPTSLAFSGRVAAGSTTAWAAAGSTTAWAAAGSTTAWAAAGSTTAWAAAVTGTPSALLQWRRMQAVSVSQTI